MLKKLFIILIAFAPLAVMAQDAKIAYLNSQEIFNAMPELADIEKQITTKREEVSKNGQALVEEFNKKAEEFEKIQATEPAQAGFFAVPHFHSASALHDYACFC